ncbi:MAG TPA: AraC family ligand binding domain-containing protein [Bryobacteraceae bacterium]|nr:AraC family ligand binding domain-containing protein [Bryobacteraceae bacterium]
MKTGLWIALALGAIAAAAVPVGYSHWNAAQLDQRARGVSAKMEKAGRVKVATEALGGWGNHSMSLVHREGTGEAELHETQSDIMFIHSGEASIVIGGTIPNPRRTSAHEIRGDRIAGGEKQPLKPGDILHVPPKTPHQMILESGQTLDYYAVKVDAR